MSVLNDKVGDTVGLGADDFTHLSHVFFDEIESRYL
jgi:hypothetical protein